jgi:hypothetical protein
MGGGGGSKSSSNTKLLYPKGVPGSPSVDTAISAYASALPQLYELFQQYGVQGMEAQQSANEALYPYLSQAGETLAQQYTEGSQAGLPDWMKNEYLDMKRSQLGNQAGSLIGADDLSLGLLRYGEEYRDKSRAGLAGLTNLVAPATNLATNAIENFNPASVMDYLQQGYNTYMQGWRPQTGSTSNSKSSQWNVL